MRGILIDPLARTVSEVRIPDEGNLSDLKKIMGCECVELLRPLSMLELWCDEKGRFKENNGAFHLEMGRLKLVPDIVGPCILLGNVQDSNGSMRMASVPDIVTTEKVGRLVTWLSRASEPTVIVITWSEPK